jgi:hypothetical protein
VGSTSESKAAPTQAPRSDHVKGDSVKHPRAGQVIAQSGRQSAEDAKKEREALTAQPLGPGSGTRVIDADGNDVEDLHELHDSTGETIVTLQKDVYEEFAAPGAPNRKIKRLLFHKGQQVPKSVLQRHQDALEANQDEVERLAALGRGTGHPKDPDMGGDEDYVPPPSPPAASTSNSTARSDDPSGSPDPSQPGEGEGTTVPPDGETKEGDAAAGEPKERKRGSVPRRGGSN